MARLFELRRQLVQARLQFVTKQGVAMPPVMAGSTAASRARYGAGTADCAEDRHSDGINRPRELWRCSNESVRALRFSNNQLLRKPNLVLVSVFQHMHTERRKNAIQDDIPVINWALHAALESKYRLIFVFEIVKIKG